MNRPVHINFLGFAAVLTFLLAACGGGGGGSSSGPPTGYATSLSYTNPTSTGYSLQADLATNNTSHLALNLVGPSGTVAQGVSLFLTADPAIVSWFKAANSAYATPGTVFNLGTAPQAFIARVSSPGMLQVGLFQKSGSATYDGAPLFTVALELQAGKVPSGTPVALAATAGEKAVYVDGNQNVQPLPAIAIGQLIAQ